MFKRLPFFFLLIPVWSQTTPPVTPLTPPPPPACLTAPVTLGNVTLNCSLIDNTVANGAVSPGILVAAAVVMIQVRVTSTDPDAIGFRIGITYTDPLYTAPDGFLLTQTAWGLTGKTLDTDYIAAALAHKSAALFPTTPGYRFTFYLNSAQPTITGIQVQELKASSSQTF